MNTVRFPYSAAKGATVFISDAAGRFSGYIASLLKEKSFSAPKERAELLKGAGVSTKRRPYYIIEGVDASEIVSFAKEGDLLFAVCLTENDGAVSLLRTAKALKMTTVLLCGQSLTQALPFADSVIPFQSDSQAVELCQSLCDSLCPCETDEIAPHFPIEHCGLSHGAFGKELDEKAFAAYKDNGISHMEISFGSYDDTLNLDFKEYKRLADKYGVTLWSFHLPFAPFTALNPSHFDETVRKFTVGYFKELMKEAKRDAGISIFVMHPSGEPIHEDDRTPHLKQLQKSVDELVAFADENGMILAVENLPRTCLGRSSEDMQKILNMHPSLKMCFDLNHCGSESAPDIIKRFGKKIITLHVSDYMGKDECHIMPGEGIVDWTATVRALKAVGYDGPFLYEISRGKAEDGQIWAKEAWHTRLFTRERLLSHADVRKNFEELMNKAK